GPRDRGRGGGQRHERGGRPRRRQRQPPRCGERDPAAQLELGERVLVVDRREPRRSTRSSTANGCRRKARRASSTRSSFATFPTARSSSKRVKRGSCSATRCSGGRPTGTGMRARRQARTKLITPPSLVSVLRCGWSGAVPLVHP